MEKNKDKKWVSLWVSKDIHKAFKAACAEKEIQMNTCILDFMKEYINSGNKKGK